MQSRSRIQAKNRTAILAAALEVFSRRGFAGATLDQIAKEAGLSKPNLLYYFPSKEAIHRALLDRLLHDWLAPLRALGTTGGTPLAEVLAYLARKVELARDFPRESRLFANEILQGAPHIGAVLTGELKALVDEKAALLGRWMAEGALAPHDPQHLLFAIWALSQHYADFEAQVAGVLGPARAPFAEAGPFLENLFTKALAAEKPGQA
jgi:TetR/AcrR family transcriptional regulator